MVIRISFHKVRITVVLAIAVLCLVTGREAAGVPNELRDYDLYSDRTHKSHIISADVLNRIIMPALAE